MDQPEFAFNVFSKEELFDMLQLQLPYAARMHGSCLVMTNELHMAVLLARGISD